MWPPAKVNSVWSFNDAWLRTSWSEARRQAPRNGASSLDAARALGISRRTRADISKSFLWEVEQGSNISGDRLLRVANVLGASLDYLLRGEPAPANFKPAKVEIPSEVHELAQELGLTYSQTMALLQVDRSVIGTSP